jgi:peptidoglycan LD-endopeptidase LytH
LNRLGWLILLIFVAGAVIFGLMLSSGEGGPSPASSPTPGDTAALRPVGDLVIPVSGIASDQLTDTWGQSRANGAREHHAIDIMANRGALVVAAAPGRIEKLFDSKDGGRTIYVRSPDGGIVYYYAHLDAYRDGLAERQQVKTGEVIGTVGSTGNADPDGPHLHFEVKRMAPGESWFQGRNVNPYPLLAGKASAR